ncbi:isopeptide-forming domain-containing fimbrial protein [uncultured Ruminococcus sp.]|uniref:isopeptide-forming domain-containing fimbrial protein n=1 Tax=uncultured Ruminococcus sp. TaxID=165186 RepID=UPI002658295E|nr:isopeptide-forming domain-containing fimbrial protein [uncultured Ruminococcus sp.]
MKKTRRFASLATAAILAACAVVPATMSALPVSAQTVTITQATGNAEADHTYSAYQIFKGTVVDGALTGIDWNKDIVNADALLTALKGDTQLKAYFENCTSAAEVAAALNAKVAGTEEGTETSVFANNGALTQHFAELVKANLKDNVTASATSAKNGTSTELNITADGYYLIVDDTANLQTGAYSRYILTTVDADSDTTLSIAQKASSPTVVKKVMENTDVADYTYTDARGSQTDKDYNDVADYNIGDAVPFKLYGTMPSTIGDYEHYRYIFHDTLGTQFTAPAVGDVTVKVDGKNAAGATVAIENNEITVTFADIKDGNTITASSVVTVEYNAVLNKTAQIGLSGQENAVKLEYSNDSYWDGSGTPTTSKTPEDKVIVFTYELDVTKQDGVTNKKLKDAEFNLKNAANKYAKVDENGYVTGWVSTVAEASVLKSDANGLFKVIGLDDGTYTLTETKAPTGYNLLNNPVSLTLDATTANGQNWDDFVATDALTNLTLTVDTGDAQPAKTPGEGDSFGQYGVVETTVLNTSGSSLPSTGGIGTTIFYVAGGVLVVGAGVLLITKKRAKDAQ